MKELTRETAIEETILLWKEIVAYLKKHSDIQFKNGCRLKEEIIESRGYLSHMNGYVSLCPCCQFNAQERLRSSRHISKYRLCGNCPIWGHIYVVDSNNPPCTEHEYKGFENNPTIETAENVLKAAIRAKEKNV
jgi:hypothetical protein